MDDMVIKAIAKWPNVPHCHGWLGLDARGNWYLRDDAVQAAGPFGPGRRGSLLEHEKLLDFISRNYAADEAGQWFFQNGPQRVYVELEAAPLVWRAQPDFSVLAHAGGHAVAEPLASLLDESGRLYLAAPVGLGLVHTQDMELASDAIEAQRWPAPMPVLAAQLPARFGFVLSPGARHAQVGPQQERRQQQ